MNNVLVFTILLHFQNTLVQCLLQDLKVRIVDKTTIARKRKDTFDMCRMFAEENSKNNQLDSPMTNIVKSYYPRPNHGRYKRSPLRYDYDINPALNDEDVQRVESTVDKVYEDVDNSVKVQNIQVQENEQINNPSRRFDFAPKELLGPQYPVNIPLSEDDPTTQLPVSQPDDGNRNARWSQGVIPYFIDPKTYDTQLAEQIVAAFDYVEKATCIRLQRLRAKPDAESMNVNWVFISNPQGIRQCVHSNENKQLDGVQISVIGYDCITQGDIVHEIMHILGYSHEHLRADRDQHITVVWDNIKPGYRKYFDITGVKQRYNLDSLPYDYASILHYPPRAFSKNGQPTIKVDQGIKIGQREGLSEIDLQKVSMIYSAECFARNKDYLDKTCATVMKTDIRPANITPESIDDYFKDRLWPFGVIRYTFGDQTEFSPEERENILAVFNHIEKETCIKFYKVYVLSTKKTQNGNTSFESSKETTSGSDTKKQTPDDNQQQDEELDEKNKNGKTSSESENITSLESLKRLEPENRVKPYKINPYKKINKQTPYTLSSNTKTPFNMTPITEWSTLIGLPGIITKRDARRHAPTVVRLLKSSESGCKCPEPNTVATMEQEYLDLEISEDCFNSVNDLLHFFVHILGLDHQHNMYDRDSYLYIIWENLSDDMKKDLKNKLPPPASVGFAYDYQSVMHYPWLDIKNGKTSIMYPLWNDGWSMGHWQGLSSTDVQKLSYLYSRQCNQRTVKAKTFPNKIHS